MALSTAVTKKNVTYSQDGLYQIILNLKYLDGVTVLIDKDFQENYWTGQAPSLVVNKFKEKMQAAIDNYKAAQAIFNSAALDTAIANLQAGLGV